MSGCLSSCPATCPYICRATCPSVRPCLHPLICPSICPSIRPSVYLAVCPTSIRAPVFKSRQAIMLKKKPKWNQFSHMDGRLKYLCYRNICRKKIRRPSRPRTWSTMPSSDERIVGWRSRCMCMIRLHRHMGAVARIGPASEPLWSPAPPCWPPPLVAVATPVAMAIGAPLTCGSVSRKRTSR